MTQSVLEILQALILSIPPTGLRKRKPTEDTFNNLADLTLIATHEAIHRFDMLHPDSLDELSESQGKVLKNIRLSRQLLRHSGYPQHICPAMSALLSPSNGVLDKHYHVTFSSLIDMMNDIVRTIEVRYSTYSKGHKALLQATGEPAIASIVDHYFPDARDSAYWLTRMTSSRSSLARRRRAVVAFLDANSIGFSQ